VDWAVGVAILLISSWWEGHKPYQRDVRHYLADPGVSWPHVEVERVPGELCQQLTIYLPALIVVLVGLFRRSVQEAHQALLTIFIAYVFMRFPITVVKYTVGRLRPDFLSRCQYDFLTEECTGHPATVTEGRKSFPSGHSSTSFVGITFFVLFLAGKTRAFSFASALPADNFGARSGTGPFASRLLRLSLTLLPFLLAIWIAISRLEDHVHHASDVLVGSTFGFLVAVVVYHIYWPSPIAFTPESLELMDKPRDWRRVQLEVNGEDGENEPMLRQHEGETV